jgi:hypothetical protein
MAALPERLCGVFLGWRLREDFEALLALGEGSLRIDLRTGEAWCEGEPIPPLFIAAELGRELARALETADLAEVELREARLDAEFSRRSAWRGGRTVPTLEITCRATVATGTGEWSAESSSASLRAAVDGAES